MCIYFFLIFALKHRLRVLSEAVLTCTYDLYFEHKKEIYDNFSSENYRFCSFFKNRCILHGRVFVITWRFEEGGTYLSLISS